MKNNKFQRPTLSEGESNTSKNRSEWEAKTHTPETQNEGLGGKSMKNPLVF